MWLHAYELLSMGSQTYLYNTLMMEVFLYINGRSKLDTIYWEDNFYQ